MVKKVLIINGVERTIVVEGTESLAEILRGPAAAHRMQDRLPGPGHCGACNVIMDGKVTPLLHHQDFPKYRITPGSRTIEGIGTPGGSSSPAGCLGSPTAAAQCGILLTGIHHERQGSSGKTIPSPTREEVRDWFNKTRNLCRCTGYKPLIDRRLWMPPECFGARSPRKI